MLGAPLEGLMQHLSMGCVELTIVPTVRSGQLQRLMDPVDCEAGNSAALAVVVQSSEHSQCTEIEFCVS